MAIEFVRQFAMSALVGHSDALIARRQTPPVDLRHGSRFAAQTKGVGGGGGSGAGGGDGGNGGESVAQMVKPALITDPSVYHVIVWPADMATLLGPVEPL